MGCALSARGIALFQKIDGIKGKSNYVAVYFNLSKLQAINRQPHYIRIAATTFDPILLKNSTSGVYTLANMDLVFVGQNVDRAELMEIIQKVRYLFSEDPLSHLENQFCQQFNLNTSYTKFYEISQKVYIDEGGAGAGKLGSIEGSEEGVVTRRIFNSKLLGAIEAALVKADVTTFIKSKPVCSVIKGASPQVSFYEKNIDVDSLISTLAPGVDSASNMWFRKYLSQVSCERALSLFSSQEAAEHLGTFSIRLSLQTVLSQEFQRFDRELGEYPRRNILVGLSVEEIINDLDSYQLVRDILKKKDYNIYLLDLTPDLLDLVDVSKLTPDFLRVDWPEKDDPSMVSSLSNNLKKNMDILGPSCVILGGCHQDIPIRFGHKIGLYLFQGDFVDKLYSSAARRNSLKNKLSNSKIK